MATSPRQHSPLSLPPQGDIHLLLVRLSSITGVDQAPTILSPDELARANRLLCHEARERFIAGRLFLRRSLGRCLGLNPAGILLVVNEWGKPRLGGEQAASGLCFNLAHTDDWAILALSQGCEVGVDIELVREELEFGPMARRFFSACEREQLFGLAQEQQLSAFYCCWTRKEAYLKGVGCGLSLPTDSFDVSLLPGHAPRLMEQRRDPAEIDRWSLADIPLPPGLCGALAVKGSIGAVRFID
ncbi:4'-phosphopantetheinyl transferase family protein [Pelobacter propionicus]|uniref:4'-phosphopantetheinyl transferase n=1 Tax=Pelobacter propionicus (strain DSM 2379 / NBRC 103807 / OttBd1) TaxID=338966 RepID=A1ATP2_PELPD|nr:4'-phosphopantetheinyl transferase superfamily protein [Pelobacter propionicus]ABL00713.1 4'-phosphopantetheinyl transferase [Pelobacter propionicus DSM 2379]